MLLVATAEEPRGIWSSERERSPRRVHLSSVPAASLHHRRALLRVGPDLPEPEPEPEPKGQQSTVVATTRDPFNVWGDRAGSRTSGGLGSEPATSSSSVR